MPPWFKAFAAASLLTLAVVPVMRRLALTADFVDVPDRRKVHRDPVPYLGGVALILAVLIGLVFETRLAPSGALLVLGAALLGTVGLIDDDRQVDPRIRLLAETAAASVALALGIRVHVTGVLALDLLLTVVWIVGVTNAFNLLDNMDGLAAGVAGVAAFSVFLLAIFGDQPAVATLAAATVGACIGFLQYNRSPASIFMGDAGSLFLGFVLGLLTIDVSPQLGPPFSFLTPLMLLAVPVLDTTTVTCGRIRRRLPVSEGGKDHLSHRLVKRGLSPRAAVRFLVTAEAALGTLAILGGRRVIPLWGSASAAVVVLGIVAAVTIPAGNKVYRESVKGFPASVRLVLIAATLGIPALAAPALAAMARASEPARQGARLAEAALNSLASGDVEGTVARFDEAAAVFASARNDLTGPLTSVGLAIPGLSTNLNAARTLTEIGEDLSARGRQLASATSEKNLIVNGRVDIAELDRLEPVLTDLARSLDRSQRRLSTIESGFLIGQLSHAVQDLQARVAREAVTMRRSAEAAQILPALLGKSEARRYFLAFQNNTEMRGSGGFIGNWGELVAEDGHLRLEHFGRLQELNERWKNPSAEQLPADFVQTWSTLSPPGFWQLLNASPDFPTTARVIQQAYVASGGPKVDGVIALDPPGLASLLQLTGPVQVAGWPVPITSDNVVDVTLRAAYATYTDEAQRASFLGNVAEATTQTFTSSALGSPTSIVRVLNAAVREGHLRTHVFEPGGARLLTAVAADGRVPPVAGDSVMIVHQNLAANKVDYYLQREVRYTVRLDARQTPARVTGRLDVAFVNDAPSSGLPEGVIGPYDARFTAGENRAYVSAYGPFIKDAATVEGVGVDVVSRMDLGRPMRSAVLSVPAKSTRTLSFPVDGSVRLTPEGWYRLDLPHQPTLAPDHVVVSITLAPGSKVVAVQGAAVESDGTVVADISQTRDHTIFIQIQRTGAAGLRDRFWGND